MTDRADLLFAAEVSVRYHRRRATFLERSNLALTLATLVAGGGAFVSLFGEGNLFAKVAALIVSAITLVQLVYTPEACAARHRQWLRDWLQLLQDIRSHPEPGEDQLRGWIATRYRIEGECVGEMRALQADCYNKAVAALSKSDEHNYRIRWWHRAFGQVISFENGFNPGA